MDFCDRTIGIIVENEDDPYATVDFNEVGAKLPLKSGIGLRTVVENQQRIELKFAVGNETRVIGITDREPFVFESAVPLPKDTLVIALLRVDENGKSTLEIEVPEFNLRQEEKDLEIDFWQETLTKGLSVTEDDFTKLQNNEAVDLSKYDENGELIAGVCASMPELALFICSLLVMQVQVKQQSLECWARCISSWVYFQMVLKLWSVQEVILLECTRAIVLKMSKTNLKKLKAVFFL